MKRFQLGGLIVGSSLLSLAVLYGAFSPSDAAAPITTATSAGGTCQQPVLAPGTPSPTSVAGPFLPSTSSGPAMVSGPDGTAQSVSPVCQWTMSFDPPSGDPTVTYTEYSNLQMGLGDQYGVNYSNNTGVRCNLTVETLNGLGGGGAQETLNSSNCNNDGYVPGEGAVQGALVNGSLGPEETVATFHSTVTSFALGANIYYGYFNACSEDPLGSHTSYACDYFYGGPTL
jgi:hypothetical protein